MDHVESSKMFNPSELQQDVANEEEKEQLQQELEERRDIDAGVSPSIGNGRIRPI